MKKGVFAAALLFFSVLFSCPSLALWYMDSDSVTVDLHVESSLELSLKPGYSLDYVTANVSFIPRDTDAQSVITIRADPKPVKITEDEYMFRWTSPVPSIPKYEIDSRVRTKSTFQEVRRISFPYSGFSSDIVPYTLPSKNIDSDNQKIMDKASELAEGRTDYYSVVFRMADWTKENIKYDLSTLNTKASHKASVVLAHRDGVCDEITTLFIALLRAVGIPAKFVSGIAYTESSEFPQKWGAHGWAEVYFPGTGWVPFDVTYGEYGYADPTHVKLKESIDSADADTRYEWLGRDVNVIANPVRVSADLVKQEGVVADNILLGVDVLQKSVGIGSYNVIEAAVTNRRNSYVSAYLFLSRIAELEVEGNNYRSVMLAPMETGRFYWLVHVIESLDSHYTYTFPVTVVDMRNTSAESAFYVVPGATVFSREEMERVIDAAVKEEEKVYSKKIEVNCSQGRGNYYVYDGPEIECSAKNAGNFPFKALEFCFEGDCRTADLAIAQEKAFTHAVMSPKPGINKVSFSVEGKDVSRTVFYDLEVLDAPNISVADLEYPQQIEFSQPYVVSFTLKRASASVPQDVVLRFDAAGNTKTVEIPGLNVDKKFLFNLDSEDLSVRPNAFTISVDYADLNGRLYTGKEEFSIGLVNVSFSQRLVIFVHDLDRWLRNLFK
ncbi:transglutaminase domain-containing protein [Candidatus Woesearchaeota archaeon]|nr:transglutaminase domain-containing protein [Candidatus Woesearchaeota archaeon]